MGVWLKNSSAFPMGSLIQPLEAGSLLSTPW